MVAIKTAITNNAFIIGLYSFNLEDYKFIEISNSENGYKYLLALLHTIAKDNRYIISFGGKHYDMPLLQYLVKNDFADVKAKELLYLLRKFEVYITNDDTWYKDDQYIKYKYNNYMHIDLSYYGNSNMYEDLSIGNIKRIDTADIEVIKKQLKLDLDIIVKLYKSHEDEIMDRRALAYTYGIKPFDISAPQVMEAVMASKFDTKEMYGDSNPNSNVYAIALDYEFQTHEINSFKDYLLTLGTVNINSMDYKFVVNDLLFTIKSGILKVESNYKGYVNDVYINDVISMYPTMLLDYEIVPKHLDKDIFLKVYSDIYDLKVKTGHKLFKQMLVSMVGYFNSLSSPWLKSHDSWAKIVLRSTLYMLQYIDKMLVDGVSIVFVNLDSICTINTPIHDSRWTSTYYDTMVIKNMNNYIAIGDSVKTSGVFTVNNKYPIIAKAIANYLKTGESYKDYIRDTNNPLTDYCTVIVTSKEYTTMYKSETIQNINRCYVSNYGDYLYKAKGSKIIRAIKEKVIIYNTKYPDAPKINYEWYINQAEKLLVTQTTLF